MNLWPLAVSEMRHTTFVDVRIVTDISVANDMDEIATIILNDCRMNQSGASCFIPHGEMGRWFCVKA